MIEPRENRVIEMHDCVESPTLDYLETESCMSMQSVDLKEGQTINQRIVQRIGATKNIQLMTQLQSMPKTKTDKEKLQENIDKMLARA